MSSTFGSGCISQSTHSLSGFKSRQIRIFPSFLGTTTHQGVGVSVFLITLVASIWSSSCFTFFRSVLVCIYNLWYSSCFEMDLVGISEIPPIVERVMGNPCDSLLIILSPFHPVELLAPMQLLLVILRDCFSDLAQRIHFVSLPCFYSSFPENCSMQLSDFGDGP